MQDEQSAIIEELGVAAQFDAVTEAERRTVFLADYLRTSGARTYVLGISGGIDSLTSALLAQAAVRRLRHSGYDCEFVAVRLPYGVQADEADAQAALAIIRPDRLMTVNVKPATDAMISEVKRDAPELFDREREDFHHGNVKARERMIAQYAIAGATHGIVIGTDHAAEALMGFFTKFGDGASDILPLAGLNKRRVRAVAKVLGAPDSLIFKVPTADLETNAPLRPDEDAYGVTYDQIDDFLEGKPVDETARDRILTKFRATAHKRALPVTPLD
ncbi:NH(3) synthetase [Rhizobium freirei PRF 81]|uniref:NH(3)-dependent NAD(+) synthetase n=1 Tax=Rhizobium freirei PRF 81 TaxID=363754 RepID=N6V0I6_9HYPH|nr:ammonia-dependent NAD(+) synthetase [Rhizobium freirei]ENN84627.1 NH(3) synthetase [Rhizobium freirei PRF 81]